MRRRLTPLIAVAAALAGCGSETVHELPPAAEPARAPALTAAPAGRVVPIGAAPEGIAADPATHVLAVALRDRVVLADARTGAIRGRVALPDGAPRHLAFGDGRFVVPAETAGRALLVTPRGAIASDAAVGDHPHDATVAAGRVFVGNERGNTLSVLDGGRVVRTVPVATQPGGLAALRDRAVAVVSVRERVLELYDARTLRRTARVPAGVGPTHVAAAGDYLYVADTHGGALLVFSTRPKLQLVRRVFLPGAPYGLALDPERHRLWVTLTARNQVVALTATSHPRAVERLPAVRQPDSVAVDSALGTVAVTGRVAGVLQLIGARDAYGEDER